MLIRETSWDRDSLERRGVVDAGGYLKLGKPELETEYYRKKYFKESKSANIIAPAKQIREIGWHRKWTDLYATIIRRETGSRRVSLMDVGCGSGIFVKLFNEVDFITARGIEPYEHFADSWRAMGVSKDIHEATLEDFVKSAGEKFDVVFLNYVLEHVGNAGEFIGIIKDKLLKREGLIICCVPNDFNPLQRIVLKQGLADTMYWVGKDHINYFTPESLKNFFKALGLETIDLIGGYPMETFTLMGMSYVGNPEAEGRVHGLRKEFEVNMPTDALISYYKGLIDLGIGRDMTAICKQYG